MGVGVLGGLVFAARLTRHRVASRLDTKHSILAHRVVQHTHRTLEAQKARARHVSCNLIDTSSKYLFGELCVQLTAAARRRRPHLDVGHIAGGDKGLLGCDDIAREPEKIEKRCRTQERIGVDAAGREVRASVACKGVCRESCEGC